MDEDANYDMWGYWNDKNGPIEALEVYYPNTLKNSQELQQAIAMIKNGERLINSIMWGMDECEDD